MRQLTMVLLTLMLVGGHTAGLQVVAWSTMFAARVQTTENIGQALVATLDGSKPCRLCVVVQELEQDADAPGGAPDHTLKAIKKLTASEPQMVLVVMHAGEFHAVPQPALATLKPRLSVDVELPPPRS